MKVFFFFSGLTFPAGKNYTQSRGNKSCRGLKFAIFLRASLEQITVKRSFEYQICEEIKNRSLPKQMPF